MTDVDSVRDALRRVCDPEVGINIVDLGLVYEISVEGDTVVVIMTFTTEGCPAANVLLVEVEDAIANLPGSPLPDVRVTFDPPWSPDMISADGKNLLGT